MMPEMPIVDSHVHFWDPARLPLPWLEGLPELNRRFLPEDFAAAAGDLEVAAMVFLECDVAPGRHREELAFVAGLAAEEPRIAAFVPHAPLERGAAVEAELAALAADPRVRGVRRLLQQERDPAFCLRPAFLEGVRLLPRFDLHFEITVYHHQMESVVRLVEACPEVRFVLDHGGKPGIAAGLFEPWASHVRRLAGLPNIVCKLSGLVTEADHHRWREEEIRPYIDHLLTCFGADRVMFGGDWPVVTLAASYRRWVEIVDRALAGADAGDRRRIWQDNARRVYRLAEGRD